MNPYVIGGLSFLAGMVVNQVANNHELNRHRANEGAREVERLEHAKERKRVKKWRKRAIKAVKRHKRTLKETMEA